MGGSALAARQERRIRYPFSWQVRFCWRFECRSDPVARAHRHICSHIWSGAGEAEVTPHPGRKKKKAGRPRGPSATCSALWPGTDASGCLHWTKSDKVRRPLRAKYLQAAFHPRSHPTWLCGGNGMPLACPWRALAELGVFGERDRGMRALLRYHCGYTLNGVAMAP